VIQGGSEESNFGRNASAPNRTIAVTHHETADRPGPSDVTVPWCLRRPPNGWVSETYPACVSTALTRCNESPNIRYVWLKMTRCVVSGSVQRGLSAIRPAGRGFDTAAPVRPDGGKTL
jgi:hypothetical protein